VTGKKLKVHHITCHEGVEWELRYSSTLSLTSALDGGWVVRVMPWPLYPREGDPVTIVQKGEGG
jgi:hypothetical protein